MGGILPLQFRAGAVRDGALREAARVWLRLAPLGFQTRIPRTPRPQRRLSSLDVRMLALVLAAALADLSLGTLRDPNARRLRSGLFSHLFGVIS
jgi:hypothetical protein